MDAPRENPGASAVKDRIEWCSANQDKFPLGPLTDFNDLYRVAGPAEVKGQFEEAMRSPPLAGVDRKRARTHTIKKPAAGSEKTSPSEAKSGPPLAPEAGRYKTTSAGLCIWNGEGYSRISDPMDVLARSIDGPTWGIVVRFRNYDGAEVTINIPMTDFAVDGSQKVIARLMGAGFRLEPRRDARRAFLEYIQSVEPSARVVLVKNTGWHEGAFVTPERVYGDPAIPVQYCPESVTACRLAARGTLEDWQRSVAMHCPPNSRLCLAVSAAFTGPLVDLIGSETCGFHFFGDSSLGKSTVLKVAASVCGSPKEYPRTYRTTVNAIEYIAASHSGLLLILDELSQADPAAAGDLLYMLGNGEGKARANDRGGARDIQHRWRLVWLSNGERDLAQHLAEAGKRVAAGMEMRMLSIPASPHRDEHMRQQLGIYEDVGNFAGGAAFSDHLVREASKHHGTALDSFLEALLQNAGRLKKIPDWIATQRATFAGAHLTSGASGQARRAADKFALVGAAGEIATRLGVTGWPEGAAMEAAAKCFREWLTQRGGDGSFEEAQIVSHLRHHFELYGESYYTRWESEEPRVDEHAPRTMKRYGFRRTEEARDSLAGNSTENIFYVLPEAFRKEVCQGIDYNRAARLLSDLGALKHEKDRYTGKARLPGLGGKPASCYIIRQSALAVDG